MVTLEAVKLAKPTKIGGAFVGLVEVPDTVEGFDLTHLYQPPLLTGRRFKNR